VTVAVAVGVGVGVSVGVSEVIVATSDGEDSIVDDALLRTGNEPLVPQADTSSPAPSSTIRPAQVVRFRTAPLLHIAVSPLR
jgi:hypothetical protein